MLLIIDNYDSFTYNLVQRFGEIDPKLDIQVVRNDRITAEEANEIAASRLYEPKVRQDERRVNMAIHATSSVYAQATDES